MNENNRSMIYKDFTSIKAFNIARHVLNSPTSQIFINGLKKQKQKNQLDKTHC